MLFLLSVCSPIVDEVLMKPFILLSGQKRLLRTGSFIYEMAIVCFLMIFHCYFII